MKCTECNGTGKSIYGYNQSCFLCNGSGIIEPMTNEEWLRNLSFDELARVLYCMIINGERIRPDLAYIKRWLKEKHNGQMPKL